MIIKTLNIQIKERLLTTTNEKLQITLLVRPIKIPFDFTPGH